jgi:hypothetical protein
LENTIAPWCEPHGIMIFDLLGQLSAMCNTSQIQTAAGNQSAIEYLNGLPQVELAEVELDIMYDPEDLKGNNGLDRINQPFLPSG